MRGRSLVIFIILNVLISIGVALGVIAFMGAPGGESQLVPITVQYVVTATPNPEGDATRIAMAVASTIDAQAQAESTALPEVDLPDEILSELSTPPTINPEALSANPELEGTASALPDGCILHEIAEGDTPFGIAEEYGVSGPAIMTANNLTEDTATQLQIGDILIVPLPNCPLEEILPEVTSTPEAEVTEEATEETEDATEEAEETEDPEAGDGDVTPTATPTVTPTATLALAPTASNAQVEIVEFLSPGDITAEGVTIVNRGSVVDITGWTLSDADDNEFVFPEQRLFTNGSVTIYTRAGEDTPVVLYWGRSTAVWGDESDVATLTDASDRVQSSVRVP